MKYPEFPHYEVNIAKEPSEIQAWLNNLPNDAEVIKQSVCCSAGGIVKIVTTAVMEKRL
jgi:hypothetical protein